MDIVIRFDLDLQSSSPATEASAVKKSGSTHKFIA